MEKIILRLMTLMIVLSYGAALAQSPTLDTNLMSDASGSSSPVWEADTTAQASGVEYQPPYSKPGCDTKLTSTTNRCTVGGLSPVSFHLAPNPASHTTILQINGQEGMADKGMGIDISDLTGRTIATHHIPASHLSNINYSLDISGLPQGAYFVRLSWGQESAVRKLVVQ